MIVRFSVQMLSKSLDQLEAGRGPWSPIASVMPLWLMVPPTFALLVCLHPCSAPRLSPRVQVLMVDPSGWPCSSLTPQRGDRRTCGGK